MRLDLHSVPRSVSLHDSGDAGHDAPGAASVTSALTEPSGILGLGKPRGESTVTFAPEEWLVEEGEDEGSRSLRPAVSLHGFACTWWMKKDPSGAVLGVLRPPMNGGITEKV